MSIKRVDVYDQRYPCVCFLKRHAGNFKCPAHGLMGDNAGSHKNQRRSPLGHDPTRWSRLEYRQNPFMRRVNGEFYGGGVE